MIVNVTKVNEQGNIGIRDYLVNEAIEKDEPLIVTFNDSKMTLSPLELKRGDIGSKEFERQHGEGKYRIVYFKWKNNNLLNKLGDEWFAMLEMEFKKDYMKYLSGWLERRRKVIQVYPDANDVFNAFKLTPYSKVKVVILGQD